MFYGRLLPLISLIEMKKSSYVIRLIPDWGVQHGISLLAYYRTYSVIIKFKMDCYLEMEQPPIYSYFLVASYEEHSED